MTKTVVMASRRGRERSLFCALASLREQVDVVALYWNGERATVPRAVMEMVDLFECDPANTLGSGAKLHWVNQTEGLYLTADDDLSYPADYVQVMGNAVEDNPGCIITLGGRVLKQPRFQKGEDVAAVRGDEKERWLNYANGATLAFDAQLLNGIRATTKNAEEADVATFCQRHRIPILCLGHKGSWVENIGLTMHPDSPTIFKEEVGLRFSRRDSALAKWEGPWKLYEPD